ncbi:RidA family protein [Labilibacter marinus]|uniref:hypothetical protein n=1 Tax=Labilibacter marinus TaxID=1477105 RepID=UPI00082DBC68|nr:hypothetical protein [Labilibacter marinus]
MRVVKQASARGDKSFENKIKDTLESLIKQYKEYNLAKLDIFVDNAICKENKQIGLSISSIIKDLFKSNSPAFIVHTLDICDNSDIYICAQIFEKSESEIQYKTILKHPYVVIKSNNSTEVLSGSIRFQEDSLLFSAQRCFDFAEQILMAEDMNFGNIYKLCNYIPDINGSSNYENTQRGNLHIFNEIKGFFFEENLFTHGKPIISNRDNSAGSLVIDFNAIIQNNESTDLSIEQNAKINSDIINCKSVGNVSNNYWFSSNKDFEIKSDDIEQQTIEIIKAITSLQNNIKGESAALKFINVNIKNKDDFKCVNEIITGIFPDTPIIIYTSDDFKNNLLIEIEGLISC